MNVVEPHVTVEYFDSSYVTVGRETFAIDANVMDAGLRSATSITGSPLPAGADPPKTTFATEVSTSDPAFPKYHYATANRGADLSGSELKHRGRNRQHHARRWAGTVHTARNQ